MPIASTDQEKHLLMLPAPTHLDDHPGAIGARQSTHVVDKEVHAGPWRVPAPVEPREAVRDRVHPLKELRFELESRQVLRQRLPAEVHEHLAQGGPHEALGGVLDGQRLHHLSRADWNVVESSVDVDCAVLCCAVLRCAVAVPLVCLTHVGATSSRIAASSAWRRQLASQSFWLKKRRNCALVASTSVPNNRYASPVVGRKLWGSRRMQGSSMSRRQSSSGGIRPSR